MKNKLIISLLLLISLSAFAETTVNWYTEYDKALEVALAEEKNLYVLITAPGWCIWCTRLEENVLSKPDFQAYLSENYVALKLLDEIDGKRNPELENFNISGYPSVSLYDYKGNFIVNAYTQDPEEMLVYLSENKDAKGVYKPLLKDLKLPEKYTFEDEGGGEYINNNDGTWTKKTAAGEEIYLQLKFDFKYLYLGDSDESHYVALPMNGTDRHISNLVDNEWVWSDLGDVRRIGGDEYFGQN